MCKPHDWHGHALEMSSNDRGDADHWLALPASGGLVIGLLDRCFLCISGRCKPGPLLGQHVFALTDTIRHPQTRAL